MLMRTKDRFGEPLRGRRPALRTRRRNDAGYTLLELLVVMGILAVLTAVATPQLMGYFGKAKTQSVQLQIENIGTALELYYMENGSYPSASVGLKALVEATPEAPRWNGPYLKKAKNLLDPWGRPYQYNYSAANGEYEAYSLGPSGKSALKDYVWDEGVPLIDAPPCPSGLLRAIKRPERAVASGGGELDVEQAAAVPARQQAFVTDIFRQRGEAEIVEKPDKPRGDAAKAFAAAAVRHEAEYFIPTEYHNPMELFTSTAMWDGGGKLTVYDKTQGVQNVQKYLCGVFQKKSDQIKVLSPYMEPRGRLPPTQSPLRFDAAILSRIRSEVTSRSTWAKDEHVEGQSAHSWC